ncbi:hypothetical protein BGX38DRAFT_1146359 [Terfezia claveryi]|nr:hypothetical protein BGX38DRAFT_1146359 [Terfezia claveryi]
MPMPPKFTIPFSINTLDPLHLPYNLQTSFLIIIISTKIVNITGKLVKRSQGLQKRYSDELSKLDRPKRWELALEVARLTQEQTEQISFVAQVQKEVIEAWTDEEYAAIHKARGKKAVADSQPETDVGESSAVAAQHPNVDLKNIDKELPGSELVVETQRSIPHWHGSSALPLKEAKAKSGAEPRLNEEVRMDKGKSRAVDAGGAKGAEADPETRKHKRAANEVEKRTVEKRRKYGLEIPIINFDIEEGVEELKYEVLDKEEKDEALVVEEAVKVLFWEKEQPDKKTAGRMLKKMIKVMKAEVVEMDND